jgi:hypothetical protein
MNIVANNQISPQSFDVSPKYQGDRMSQRTPLTSSHRESVLMGTHGNKVCSPVAGVTIINNDYSKVNFTQNINIDKFVKIKKKGHKKKYYQQLLAQEIMSEFHNNTKKLSSKPKKTKK